MQSIFNRNRRPAHGTEETDHIGEIIERFGKGGQRLVAEQFQVSRNTIRKGQQELESGAIEDRFHERERLRAEEKLPNLLEDIQSIVDGLSQTDPSNVHHPRLCFNCAMA